ncbi:Sec-independent protein translocase protein TatB [Pararobbsia silviterrae]|uniref:Sec-independent protein translocase protein TatB n=1 Tax=Pararobbsia silviterrae TaxID=1792498 RepID=A0A494XB96_9BURK|nr:Sec-independent protein translocase protein TatB [Pararobbsia silviterrae]RKP45746.1 Sec-independent protein translocase subunit TatB [Pararobbsia silviterrae]
MLDLGLSKMALIGVVALVVIGPERLPRVARLAGTMLGRAQRYINDVKAEVTREMELDELRKMKTGFEDAARNVENTVHDAAREQQASITDAWSQGESVASNEIGADVNITGTPVVSRYGAGAPAPKRKNWRVKQTAMPNWYKRVSATRTRVQSGAARVARHTPPSLRRPIRFL